MDLIERLRAVNWEVTDEGDRMPDDPAHKCVFVDMRPDDFRALLREAAAALEAAREDGERLDWLDIHRGDDVKQCPVTGDPVLFAHYWAIDGQCNELRDAIDQARGKGIVPEQGEGS